MRSVYGAGIYDYLMDNDIYPFDLGIGVSAGAADLATYFARQRGRVLRYYTIYPKRKEYMGLWPLLRYGTFMNLKYIYEDLSLPGKEDPFDADAYTSSHTDMVFIATDAETGKPAYFPKDALKKGEMTVLEASAALPVACKPIRFRGRSYFDGGISDPIPYEKAFSMGAEKVVVILTKPEDMLRDPQKDEWVVRRLQKKHPAAAETMRRRAETYNSQILGMRKYIESGKLLVVAPDDTCNVTTTKHRKDDILRLYDKGYKDAVKILPFIGA